MKMTLKNAAVILAAVFAASAVEPGGMTVTRLPWMPAAAVAQDSKPLLPAMGVPARPKVPLRWDLYHDVGTLGEAIRSIAAAYPNLARAGSIGKSHQGRDLHLITVTNFATGDDRTKPAMWIDGNIHGNEIQGSEVALYTAWYLTEMYGTVPEVTALLDRAVLYIVPSINPDGRDDFFHSAHNMHSSRTGQVPVDNDNDGRYDEDGPDDLDGDGNIAQLRVADPNGRMKADPDDPRRLVPAKPDERGFFVLLGDEGFDNDGDGEVNEDGPGGYDPNRDWPSDWQPSFIQPGAHEYPVSLPETRAVVDFVTGHPNIGAFQTYHNYGGMILRGPGDKDIQFNGADMPVFDAIGKKGEEMLPGYRYLILWKDLYTVHGGEIDWFYLGRGIIGFSNELWTEFNYFREASDVDADDVTHRFNRLLLLGDAFVDWKPYDHPTYGPVEIGGFKKNFGRMPPGFLLQEECHRNMAFTLYHASQLPMARIEEPRVTSLGGGLNRIRVTFANEKLIPTRSAHDVENHITPTDRASLSGNGISVVSAGVVPNRFQPRVEPADRHADPASVKIETLPSMGTVTVEWIARGSGPAVIAYETVKGGAVRREIHLP